MLRTKQTYTYIYYQFIQHHYTHNTPARQLHHRYQYINSKYTSPFFLIFTYCIENNNLQGILLNYDPITQIYIFCPLTKLFNVDESRPLIVPHEFLQPVEVPILEFIFNTRYNHKLYNHMISHLALKSTTSLKHSSCFGHFFKLNTSFVC